MEGGREGGKEGGKEGGRDGRRRAGGVKTEADSTPSQSPRRPWRNFYIERENTVAQRVLRKEKELVEEKAKEDALVREIEAQAWAQEQEERAQVAAEGEEEGRARSDRKEGGKCQGYTLAAPVVEGRGSNVPSAHLMTCIHQANRGGTSASAALQAIPLAKKVGGREGGVEGGGGWTFVEMETGSGLVQWRMNGNLHGTGTETTAADREARAHSGRSIAPYPCPFGSVDRDGECGGGEGAR
jgi:hypothetical protein